MAESTKLKRFNAQIDPKILEKWKETITGNESKKDRLEEALQDNTKKHLKEER